MYVKDISAKIRRTLTYKREQGQFVGSFAPYGYQIDPADKHHLIVDTETAPVVRRIFTMYAAGEGYRHIVQALNADGIPNPSAYKRQTGSRYVNNNECVSSASGLWTQTTIARMLPNEVYTGTLVQGKTHHISYKNKRRKKVAPEEWVRIPNAHEVIIDAETWARTQERISSNTRVGKRSQELSPLSGKVRCAVCGRPMKRNVYYNSKRTIKYYNLQCASYKTGAMYCPNTSLFSGKVLEETILTELNRIVAEYCQSGEISFGGLYEEQIRELENALTKLQSRQVAAKQRLLATYKDKLDGIISEDDYRLFRVSLTAEEQEITERISSVNEQIAACRTRMANAEGQKALLKQYTHFDHLDRMIADEFIEYVEIGMTDENGEREIHIHWKI